MFVREGLARLSHAALVPTSIRSWVSYRTPDHFVSPLTVARVRRSIVDRIDQIDARQLWPKNGAGAMPRDEFNRRLSIAILRATHLGLHRSRTLSVLDIGCGAGFFLAAARHFQHVCSGTELPPAKLGVSTATTYDACIRALRCFDARRILEVKPYVPMALEQKFDLITAGLICFNEYSSGATWSRPEWEFFLADAVQYLRPGGRLYLEFNEHQHYGALRWYDRDTQALFTSSGILRRNKFLYAREAIG